MKGEREYTGLEVAIIGMSGRFPGAATIQEFWQKLTSDQEMISQYNASELATHGFDPEYVAASNFIGAVGKLEDPEWFDSSFFGFSHAEAEVMDPQIRVMLECAYEAMQDSGYNPFDYKGYVGVYTGASSNELWEAKTILSGKEANLGQFETEFLKNKDFISSHISYRLNLKGPSLSTFTACSTSLTTVHLACQALLNGECDMALAGGVSINLVETFGYAYQEGMILSKDGHCKPFDRDSSGTISSDGAGIVLLKPLDAALRDGDNIYATILASAINNDGTDKIGFTAPSLSGQVDLMKTAYQLAEISPETISYIETHGTATSLGDSIEFEALRQAFSTEKQQFCALGAVKSNVGHMDAAAGIGGLIKVALSLKNKKIPGTVHFNEPNEWCDLESSPFYLTSETRDWTNSDDSTPRRAAISSLGIGGSNAHLVLEEIEETAAEENTEGQLLLLSAKSPDALQDMLDRHISWSETTSETLQNSAFTLMHGREVLPYRTAIYCNSLSEAKHKWQRRSEGSHLAALDKPKLVYLVSGQGTQYSGMYSDLYLADAEFKKSVDACLNFLSADRQLEIKKLLFEKGNDETLKQTGNSQISLFVTGYAIAQKLMISGMKPDAMIGHSIGEYVCACLSGAMRLEDAVKLVELRGKLMQEMPAGKMVSIGLSAEKIKPFLSGKISLAAVNSDELCVVSGDVAAIDQLVEELKQKGVFAKELHTSHAFHSHMMEPMLAAFQEKVDHVETGGIDIPYLSNVTGTWISVADFADKSYWGKHLRQEVRFHEGVQELLGEPGVVFVEIGPGNALCQLVRSNAFYGEMHRTIQLVRKKQEEHNDLDFLKAQLGLLWETGHALPKDMIAQSGKRISLPTYPFERERYWIDGALQDWIQHTVQAAQPEALPVENWLNKLRWKRRDQPMAKPGIAKSGALLWFDFSSEGKLETLANTLSDKVVHVRFGEEFKEEAGFQINGRQREHFLQLFRALKQQEIVPGKIMFAPAATDASVEAWRDEVLKFMLHLSDAASTVFPGQSVEMDVITQNMYDVLGTEMLHPAAVMALGVWPVISQEYSQLEVRITDLDVLDKYSDLQLAYWLSEVGRPTVLALRNGCTWEKTFDQIVAEPSLHWKVAKDDVYLITGGLGNVGLKLAAYFAESGHCTIHLAGRSLPSEDSARMQQVTLLREKGAQVELHAVDVTSQEAFNALLDNIYFQHNKLTGIVHAAAEMADCIQLIGSLTSTEIDRITTTKVRGAQIISDWSIGKNIDFIALMSSVSTELGGLGYSVYAASNAFLDALALSRSQEDTRWLSINWDGWQLTQDQTDLSINAIDGKLAFGMLLGQTTGQTIVSTTSLEARRKQWLQPEAQPAGQYAASKKYKRPALNVAYEAPHTPLQRAVTTIWENFFQIQDLGINDDFFALGGDSLKGMMLVNRYKELIGEMVYVSVIFEATTIAETAKYFHKHYGMAAAAIDGLKASNEAMATVSTISAAKVAEMKNLLPTIPADISGEKNKKAVFIISSSRSGSTLLRVMLAGNPALFAPPELELMNDQFMEGGSVAYQGLIRSLMAIFDWDANAATKQVEVMIAEKWSVKEVYRYMQDALESQILVEKTPSYAFNQSILERIEAEFDQPIFIHLVRHPYGMINSKKNARLDLLRGELEHYFQSGQELAEFEWVLANNNCEVFLSTIDAHRHLLVRYEDLVLQPEETAQAISELIGIPFHEDMLNPYADGSRRMTDGVHEQSIMIGDPKFHTHRSIAKENAYAWRSDVTSDFLHADTLEYAQTFGYLSIDALNAQDWNNYAQSNRYPVSSQQRKLLIYQDLFSETTNYNIPRAITVQQLDQERVQRAVQQLADRHSLLRTSFAKVDGQYYQQIAEKLDVTVDWVEIDEGQTESELLNMLVKPFDVGVAPLFKVNVLDRKNGQNVIFFDTHHILTDAISQNLLISELIALYEGADLPEVEATYHEYAALQCSPAFQAKLKLQEAYWLSSFAAPLPVLELETDFPRPELLTFSGAEVKLEMTDWQHAQFESAVSALGVSRYILAFSLYQLFLHKITGQEDIIVGTPVTRRPEQRFESTVGMFVNTLPVRSFPENAKTIAGFVGDVKQRIIDVFNHADYSFDDLVNKLQLTRDFSRNPVFDSMFVFQNFDVSEHTENTPAQLEFVSFGEKISRYDLSCVMYDFKDAVNVHFEYNTALFAAERMQDYAQYFNAIWDFCLSEPNAAIQSIPDFTTKEMQAFAEGNDVEGLEIEFNF